MSWPERIAMGTWLAATLTALVWVRASHNPPGWGWLLVAALFVPGFVVAIVHGRRRQARTAVPPPDGPVRPRTFRELPSSQKSRLVGVTVCAAVMVLLTLPLPIIELVRGRFGPADAAFLLIPLLAALMPLWLWWRLMHRPTAKLLHAEHRARNVSAGRAYLPLLVLYPGQWIAGAAYRAASSEPLGLALAFVVCAGSTALVLGISETTRKETADQNPPPVPAS